MNFDQRWLRVAFAAILVVAGFRCWTLFSGPRPPRDLMPVRAAVLQAFTANPGATVQADGSLMISDLDSQIADMGVKRIQLEHFDPEAVVVLYAGPDGQPGVAGTDDNGDAIVDNRVELGATRSDDLCVIASSADVVPEDEPTLILQRGAYVPMAPSGTDSAAQRLIVTGADEGKPWSFLIDVPSTP